jgi:putative transposase
LALIRPGKPTNNGICELFNDRLRDECFNVHEFKSIEEARCIIESLKWEDYNEKRFTSHFEI